MADDFLNDPAGQGFPSELDPGSPYSGNRPASGARRATPGEVLSQGFQGAQNAGDFLGLDTEFTASQDPNQFAQGGLDLVPPPSTHDAAGYDPAYAEPAVPVPAPLPAGDAAQDFAQAPSAFEFGEDLGSEHDEEGASFEAPAASKTPLLVGALVVAALGAGGYFYGPTLYSRFFPSPPEVAEVTPRPPKAPRGATPDSTPAEPTPSTSLASTSIPTPSAVEPSSPEPEVANVRPEPVVPSTRPGRRSEPWGSSEPEVAKTPSAPSIASDSTPALLPSPSTVAGAASFPDLAGGAFDWASSDQLELIWRGSEVPLGALQAPAKTIMPRVGNVRVFTHAGSVFDGRLYAVGQNRVWLDTKPGRVGLDGDQVERIEVLPPLPPGTTQSDEAILLASSKRVRVRVPGGMLYGRVLKVESDDVMLALDDGGRVRVKATELEDLGSGRAIVVRR
jgi:hypothetical protein